MEEQITLHGSAVTRGSDRNSRDEGEFTFLDLILAIAKRKTSIAKIVLSAAVLSAVVSLLMPNQYTASTEIMPPQRNQSGLMSLLGQMGGLAGLAGDLGGARDPNNTYVAMLKSRSVADAIIRDFDLQKAYGTKSMAATRDKLASYSTISTGPTNTITIEFTDRDPKRAADIANAYVRLLRELSRNVALSDAAGRRQFFERELRDASEKLSKAEDELKRTQQHTGVILIEGQVRVALESAARIRAEITAGEVALRGMSQFATDQNPDVVRLREQIRGLRAKLAAIEGTGEGSSSPLSTGKLSKNGIEYLRSLRELKYREAVYEILAKQFESAKLDEANDVPTVQVIDPAIVPDRKSRPARTLIVLGTVILSLFCACMGAIIFEHLQALGPEERTRLHQLREHLGIRTWRVRAN